MEDLDLKVIKDQLELELKDSKEDKVLPELME
jgi:hypothetical protein